MAALTTAIHPPLLSARCAVGGAEEADGAQGPRVMDEAAFRAFYTRTAQQLRAYLIRAGGNDWSLADDLVQEAYYRFLRSGFSTDDENHRKNYLYRIATNLLRDHLRKVRRTGTELAEADEEIVDRAPSAQPSALHHDMGRLLQRLKTKDRQLLWMAHVEEFSHQEIAQVLGLKAASIRSMLFRARRRLALLLEEQGFDAGVLL
jgi:RNA polymerase sigma-70 factor (ECF subfamily)